MTLNNYQLQFITHHNDRYSYIDSARIALEGGCRWIQLRMKEASEELFEETALAVQSMCREHGATFIIDDNVALVKRIGADGVHLGKRDMPIAEARKILGEDFIIGSTVNTFEDITNILRTATPDYFGCGPYRYTTTKQNLAPTLGIEGYGAIVEQMRKHNISIPIVAIGGITKADIPAIMACGMSGIALSGSIINAEHPVDEMKEIVHLL
jgi:thiamine-phosphate pyrophosphorylase